MNRKQKTAMLSLLCVGLLLIGVGIGVSFAEFSSFTYVGARLPKAAVKELATFVVPLEQAEGMVCVSDYSGYLLPLIRETDVQSNEAVAPDTVRIDITYEGVSSEPVFWTELDDDPETMDRINLGWTSRSEFAALMACKDAVLEDLQNRRIGEYQIFRPIAVTITTHPDTIDRVTVD